MKMRLCDYITQIFEIDRLILVRSSTANRRIKRFSYVDAEVYGEWIRKPYLFNDVIEKRMKESPHFVKENYTAQEKTRRRERQLSVDLFFKYMISGDKACLEKARRRLRR